MVVLDDVGADRLSSFGAELAPPTPTIDCLCARGLSFDRAWSAPLCSPGRAALATGRQSDRTGIGHNVEDGAELSLTERTIGEVMREGGLRTAWIGKWHLSGADSHIGLSAPNLQGFDRFSGSMGNLANGYPQAEGDYYHYMRVIDGEPVWTNGYATSVAVDDALAFIEEEETPFGMVLALNAAHKPLHVPPRSLISEELPEDASELEMYLAMLEAADRELGRLLRSMDPEVLAETLVAVTSDNGSSNAGSTEDLDGSVKATLFEGGLRVPFVLSGPPIRDAGARSDALVHLVDLLPTFASLLGVPAGEEIDGVDLAPLLRGEDHDGPDLLVSTWSPARRGPEIAVRDARYKLIDGATEVKMFDLDADPHEQRDLLDAPLSEADRDAFERLSSLAASGPGIAREP